MANGYQEDVISSIPYPFYQDIQLDIHEEFQRVVTNVYYLWIIHITLLFANMIAALFFLFCGGDSGQVYSLPLDMLKARYYNLIGKLLLEYCPL